MFLSKTISKPSSSQSKREFSAKAAVDIPSQQDTLLAELSIDKDVFYNADKIAISPMGFVILVTGSSADLSPRLRKRRILAGEVANASFLENKKPYRDSKNRAFYGPSKDLVCIRELKKVGNKFLLYCQSLSICYD